MAAEGGPDIVYDGLVLALNAADKNSYPGSGTTWKDISGNSNNGTLTNGPTFSADGGGGIVFDGTNDYVDFTSSTPGLGLSTFSLECWFYKESGGSTANTGGGGLLLIPLITKGIGEVDGNNRDMNYAFGIDTSNRLVADFESYSGGGNNPITTSTVLSNDKWYHAVAMYDGSKWEIYLDGSLIGTSTKNTTPRYDSIQWFGVGVARNSTGATSGAFKGKISTARVYDRALTASEVLQNYNATKKRFGL